MIVLLGLINGILAGALAAFLYGYLHQRYPDYGFLSQARKELAAIAGCLASIVGFLSLMHQSVAFWAFWLPISVIGAPLAIPAFHGFCSAVLWSLRKVASFGENLGARAREEHEDDQAH